ncbi:hypothetical protein ACMYR3_06105 [Ampullimonas aquatilis]|uniref:hypothetical protein n=1 Tax=Ampullimonas aquatilis TaxID=1341549 RepID=UPI003C76BB63
MSEPRYAKRQPGRGECFDASGQPLVLRGLAVTKGMRCCNPHRDKVGLVCEPGLMLICLAEHCATLPDQAERRRFIEMVRMSGSVANMDGLVAMAKDIFNRNKMRKALLNN